MAKKKSKRRSQHSREELVWWGVLILVIATLFMTANLAGKFAPQQGAKEVQKAQAPSQDTNEGSGAMPQELAGPQTPITITIVGKDLCENCFDVDTLVDQVKNIGVNVEEEKTINGASEEGIELINTYNIQRLPTIIFSKELKDYTEIVQSWDTVGTVEDDGKYILREVQPPYFDLQKKEIAGIVGITYLTDSSCTDCYQVTTHKEILTNQEGFNLRLGDERTVDISSEEGKKLVAQYKITTVPTVILSKEASAYMPFTAAWEQVGTVEEDGSYVFRENNIFGDKFKTLE